MKVQIQRIGRSAEYNHHPVDDRLVEGTIKGRVTPGKELLVQFNRISMGDWLTTKVVRVEYLEGGMHVYTKNSIYRIVKGWKE